MVGTGPQPIVARTGLVLGGRYELRAHLGTGGMAQVWSAVDGVLNRIVAVKLLHPHLLSDTPSVERFRREALAVAALSHPNIVAVFDTITSPEAEAIVMEYVDGMTLRTVLDDRGVLSTPEVTALATALAGALAHAHRHGVVHRDIKPANILITTTGAPKLTDFGIAKAANDPELTVVGTIVGTANYLSPEQVRNTTIDRRADLYSLSVVVYESLTGQLPFSGDDATSIALARLHQSPTPISTLGVPIPGGLAAIVMRNLESSPDRRFQSADDLVDALRAPDAIRSTAAPESSAPTVESGRIEPTSPPAPPSHDLSDDLAADLPDAASDEGTRRGRRRHGGPRKSIVGRVLLVILIAGPLVVLGALIASPLTGEDPPTTTTPERVVSEINLASVTAFDPQGDGTEHDDETPNLLDGDPDTTWTTERYNDRTFGAKDGVGIIIDLGETHEVEQLTVTGDPGWSAAVSVTESNPATRDTPPDPTTVVADADAVATIQLDAAPGRYVTVWFTDLGPANDGRHTIRLSGVTVTGRSGA